ncbi:hypothetical protein BKA61DRAFT_705583 [Leptodontidium sp. MPI-SDFR-AT-0119]|nr:hypothetical protein BKA61DRAFT_705583 [Leptodontidium sp. MPI-SDFR-AT-0119]
MSSDVTQLLNRIGLSLYQERLADNGFDSLECLYGITEHDLETLNIERGDRRTLQQELRRREAQNSSRDLADSSASLLSNITPCTEASATHKRHITHRDIKLENILVMDKSYRVKLADFGLAKVIDVPLEILEQSGRRKYTSSVDI